jgi:hypothetical protein
MTTLESTPARPVLPSLLTRYGRPLTFGALLDETFRIFRSHWVTLVLVFAGSSVASGLGTAVLGVWLGQRTFSLIEAASELEDPGQFGRAFGPLYGAGLVLGILTYVVLIPALGAAVVVADGAMRGLRVPVREALKRGLRATPSLLGATILSLLLGSLMVLASIPLLIIGLFGILGGFIAFVAVLIWWGNPRARRNWLRWLIILATPFGLPVYYAYRWSLLLPVIVLERTGPWQGLKRSSSLVSGHWFRVFGVALVIGLLVSVLQSIPSMLVGGVLGGIGMVIAISSAEEFTNDPSWFLTLNSVVSALSSSIGLIVFGGLAPLGLSLLFIDLRNRREGTDLAERLAALEAAELDRT